jgi:RsiW-degrading membrane proteinase PrsW (M82 family)
MTDISIIIFSLVGGILPALIWLHFWLREDAYHPEPLYLIMSVFLAGAVSVILVVPFEEMVNNAYFGMNSVIILLWALIEEASKFLAAYFIALRGQEDNEPLDPMIYMIVAALGFVALENALFIRSEFIQGGAVNGILIGNLRFIGASLLHIVSSSVIGSALALNFYKSKKEKFLWFIFAVITAVLIHAAFNMALMSNNDLGMFTIFGAVWLGITALILMFEKVKTIVSPKQASASEVSTIIPRG